MEEMAIRKDFPLLKDLIYLDSASTSLTPEPVIMSLLDYYRSFKANVGRGVYRTAQLADQRYRNAHQKAAEFVGGAGTKGTAVFTRNTTESINIIARGLKWKRGDRIVTTLLEHHSNLLPWLRLKEMGIELQVVRPDRSGRLDIGELERAIAKGARLVAMSQLSNALGTVLPVKEVGKICREHDSALLVDAAQSVPHMPVNVLDIGCDFLCFSGHKMLAPMGSGVLWIRNADANETNERIEPLLVGGGMVQDVSIGEGDAKDGCSCNECDYDYQIKPGYEGYEAGTPDISAGIGLGAAVDYLQKVGIEDICHHEERLTSRLLEGLQGIAGVRVYGPGPSSSQQTRGGVVSFVVEGLLPHEVALMLDQASNICVRSGHHCCIPLMKHLGLKYGTVRASLYLYNTVDEIEKLLAAVEQIARMA
jgi:cysteine desulfurase/selenocysteine lyase